MKHRFEICEDIGPNYYVCRNCRHIVSRNPYYKYESLDKIVNRYIKDKRLERDCNTQIVKDLMSL